LNAYGFAAGDPINYADPFGLCPWWMNISPGRCKAFDRLRPAERAVVEKYGYKIAGKAYDIWGEAQTVANEHYPKGRGKANGLNDAFKHTYGSCRLTQATNANIALDFGEGHENILGNPTNSAIMDRHNNGVGRSVGSKAGADCEQATAAAVESGRTVVQHDGATNGALEASDPETSAP
jgi:hypothetical protein